MRFCSMAWERVWVTCSWPTTSTKRCGRYFRAMTWYDIGFTIDDFRLGVDCTLHASIANLESKIENWKSQGDHGGCGANYRCCIPALAGFVSPHSMGPGKSRFKLSRGSARIKN